ncbi:MAG: sugar phosphate isomerase/epimerase family protein [Chryseosolibacter sp.]
MKRRAFIQTTALTAAGIFSLPVLSDAAKVKGKLGLQLYTLRDTIPNDPKGVLKKVAGYGYKELETYSYRDGKIFGMDFSDFGNYVKDLGMRVCSGHYGLDQATGDAWGKAIDDAKAIGQGYMVVPYLVETDRKTIDDYKKVCGQLNKAGEACQKQGIRFGYHNHAFEFDKLEGQTPFDVMLAELDPKYVGIEMDIYWVIRAGADPIQYFERHPGRFEQWHVKDMDKQQNDRNADIGKGSIDYEPLFAKARTAGMKHWYVEQESYPGEPIDSVGASADFLKKRFKLGR